MMHSLPQGTARLRVLVADDDSVSRRLISAALRAEFELFEVKDGFEAIAAFSSFLPDVVLLDVDMPRVDGVAAAKEIKAMAGERFVPVFLVSGLEEQPTLLRGLEGGADDFLPKPFNVKVFRLKLDVFLRLQSQHNKIIAQNKELEAYQRETQTEHALAAQIFERMLHRAAPDDERLRMSLTSTSVFNGDAVLAATTAEGHFRLLVADVSGHGLIAALGTLPLSSLFYSATERGEQLLTTVDLINQELTTSLPSHLFCSAVIIELDRHHNELMLVNAGMPSVFLRRGPSLLEFSSKSTPLGITRAFVPIVERVPVHTADQIFAMSDGLVECANPLGELFGVERVRSFLANADVYDEFDDLLNAVTSFAQTQSDDLTLVELIV